MIIGKAISPFALRKKNGGGGGGTDPDAQLFITATGISGTNATATNKLVIDLKAANIWTKMKCIYPFVGNTASSQKFNLKDARDLNAAYRLVFSGGGTFSSNGYQPNGTNSFADTFLTTSAMALNSGHLSYYSRTNSTILGEEMGALQNSPNSYTDLVINYSGFGATFRYNDGSGATGTANANTQGFYAGSRTASNLIKLFKNGLSIQSLTSASNTTSSTRTIFIGAINNSGTPSFYSNRECAFASIGDGLTDAEVTAFYNAVQTFNTTLGRQV